MYNTNDEKRVIALGFFDGVHRGHGELLKKAKEAAGREDAGAAVLTFDRHPENIIEGHDVPLINSRFDREDLIKRIYNIDEVIFAHFDLKMMQMPWESFLSEYLVGKLNAVHLVAGHDFHFGYKGMGNPGMLRQWCADNKLGCDIIPKIECGGITVSSTYIRELIGAGEMESANKFLGHAHCLTEKIVHGKRLGRTIGIPTANLIIPKGVLIPAFGVYATNVVIDGIAHPAVTNVGVRPTVCDSESVTVESFILDFDGDIYGRTVRVDFYKYLRGERKFDSLQSLKDEIDKNEASTREFFTTVGSQCSKTK